MSVYGTLLDQLEAALRAAAPARIVGRDLTDYASRPQADLVKGAYTIVSAGVDVHDDQTESIRLIIAGEIEIAESSAPSAVEEAELAMIDELRAFARGLSGMRLRLGRIRQSAQLDAPYGWISADAELGPFDPADIVDPSMHAFVTFHAESDITGDGAPEITTEEALPQ